MSREINLALGGGGVRGIAHLGVVQCLMDNGYKINGIAGTSAGGLFGAIIAAGHQPADIAKVVNKFFGDGGFRSGVGQQNFSLLGTSGLINALEPFLKDKQIADLPIPFVATAVSLKTGQEIILRDGDVMQAVLSTIAIPGIFPSQGNEILVDGGIMDPVPVDSARAFDTSLPVVAILLHRRPAGFDLVDVKVPLQDSVPDPIIKTIAKTRLGELMRHLTVTIDVVSNKLSELRIELSQPDVLVEPEVGHFSLLQNVESKPLIDEGYQAMEASLEDLDKAFSLISSFKRITKYGRARD